MKALREFLLAPPGTVALEQPAGARARRRVSARSAVDAVPGAVALLCAPEDARAAGVAAATLLARRARAACGLACIWTAPEPHRHPEGRTPACRAARRLATALDGRGLAAQPCGRAVAVALDAEPARALADARRAAAAAGEAPAVLVLGGPRPATFDALLAEQDLLLVLARPATAGAMASLAVAGLPDTGPARACHALALGPASRALAATGIAVPAALRRALASPLDRRG